MNIAVVLHEPRQLVNIAGVVRAMANMGLSELVLVDPADYDPWRITGIAHRTDRIVEKIHLAASLDDALRDTTFVVGTSARPRTAQRNYRRPRALAPAVVRAAREGRVALVFGREDRGLSNQALDRCHEVVVIPTDPEYPSLNLAQAVLLLSYELMLASGRESRSLPVGKRSLGPATADNMEEMYRALEAGLAQIDFFRARKAESVMRTVRTVFGRTRLDAHEARLIRSIGYQMRNRGGAYDDSER